MKSPHRCNISRLAFEDLFGDGKSGHGLWPASVERKMCNDLFEFRFGQTVFFCPVEMEWQLFTVSASNKCSNGNETAITWREFLSFPDVSKQDIVSKFDEFRRKVTEVLF